MSNKKAGTYFEKEFCQLASKAGFWAHILNVNARGQPADVIIAKNSKTALVDCKDCETDVFKFSRIEENQELSMTKWVTRGNRRAVFALKVSMGIRVIPFTLLYSLREKGLKQLNLAQMLEYSWPFEEWVGAFDGNDSDSQ